MKIPKAVGEMTRRLTLSLPLMLEGKDKKQSTATAQSHIDALERGKCPGLLSV